jgi:hypothetical protein
MKFLNSNMKRSISPDTPCGLYIEIKEFQWYQDEYSRNIADLLFTILENNGLETIEKSTEAGIPIII